MMARDSGGSIEGLPLQLIITAVVMAITIPMMFGALKSYDRSKIEAEVLAEIEEFTSAARLVYVSGPGNSATADFRVPAGGLNKLEYVIFGDAPGGIHSSVIRYRIGGMAEQPIVVESPNVPMMSRDNSTLELMPGSYKIFIRCQIHETDLNGDGLWPDNYVQLSLSSV